MYWIKPSEKEINDQLNLADEAFDGGTKVPGMSYEEGVAAGIRWVCGLTNDKPIEEDLDEEDDE